MREKISAGTIARTIVLALALLNQCLTIAGYSPLPIVDAQVETLVSTVWTVLAALAAWWKNNSFTRAALAGDVEKERVKKREG